MSEGDREKMEKKVRYKVININIEKGQKKRNTHQKKEKEKKLRERKENNEERILKKRS